MQYKISNKQEKTSASTGKHYVSATLTDEQGVEYTGINAFNGEFNVADTWHGELVKNGNYYNLVSPKQSAGNNFKTMQTEKLMDKKAESITKAQDHKELGIKIASTMANAVNLAIAEYGKVHDETITAFGTPSPLEKLIEKWREYLWFQWDDIDKFPPFN